MTKENELTYKEELEEIDKLRRELYNSSKREFSTYTKKLSNFIELVIAHWPNISNLNITALIRNFPHPFSTIEDRDIISLDIETSGLLPGIHGILSMGAVNLSNGNTFYIECKLDKNKECSTGALNVNGFTREEVYDEEKITGWEAVGKFCEWYVLNNGGLLMGQNLPSLDVAFINQEFKENGESWTFEYHYLDLHSCAYQKLNRSLSLNNLLKYLELEPEPNPHNALTGAKKTAEAYRHLQKI